MKINTNLKVYSTSFLTALLVMGATNSVVGSSVVNKTYAATIKVTSGVDAKKINKTIQTTSAVKLRRGTSVNAKVIAEIDANTKLKAVKETPAWYKVKYDSSEYGTSEAWINKSENGVKLVEDVPTKYSIETYTNTIPTDVKGHKYEKEIMYFIDGGKLKGYEDGSFGVKNNVTRAEFITFINRVYELSGTTKLEFSDVKKGDWYYDYVATALANGVISKGDAFRPNDKITREEVAVVITNLLKNKDVNLDKINRLSDKQSISSWAQTSVEGLLELGYHVENNKFNPKGYMSRGDMSKLVYDLTVVEEDEENGNIPKDVKGHKYQEEIMYFINGGNLLGYPNGVFRPNDSATRAEFISFVTRIYNLSGETEIPFSDVKQGDWYYDYVSIALANGVISSDTKFRPNDKVTREEIAMVITNLFDNKDSDLDKIEKLRDKDKVSAWAKTAVEGLLELGYETENGEFKPKSAMTRGESIKLMYELYKIKPNLDNKSEEGGDVEVDTTPGEGEGEEIIIEPTPPITDDEDKEPVEDEKPGDDEIIIEPTPPITDDEDKEPVEDEKPGDDFDAEMGVNPDTDQVVDNTPVVLPDDVLVEEKPEVPGDDVEGPVEDEKPGDDIEGPIEDDIIVSDTDVPEEIKGHKYEKEITYFIKKGNLLGYEDGSYRVENELTRAEFITFINRVYELSGKTDLPFSDVKEGDWYYEQVSVALANGIISKDTKFRPNDKITRQEIAMVITNLFDNKDVELDKIEGLNDKDEIADWAKTAVEGLLETGYEVENNEFNPKGYMTRAEMSKLVYDLIGKRVDNNVPTDVKGHEYEKEIVHFINGGNLLGYPNGNFGVNNDMTRAEFVTFITRVYNLSGEVEIGFNDVKKGDWYYNYISIALANEIISKEDNFRPNDKITREEIAMIVASLIKVKDAELDKVEGLDDKDEISKDALSSVESLLEIGYKVENNKFAPKSFMTRAQIAKLVYEVSNIEVKENEDTEKSEDEDTKDVVIEQKSSEGIVFSSMRKLMRKFMN